MVFKLEQSNLASVCFTLVLCKFVAVLFHPFSFSYFILLLKLYHKLALGPSNLVGVCFTLVLFKSLHLFFLSFSFMLEGLRTKSHGDFV